MSATRVLYPLLLSACATTGSLGLDSQSPQHARVELTPVSAVDTAQAAPRAIDPQLPSADRISHIIDARLGGEVSAHVRLCVTPDGKVAEVRLEREGMLGAFDQAVMTDVMSWRFAPQPGPENVRTCESATIVYRPHRT